MGNNLQRLLPKHFKVLDYCLAGLSTKAIATELNMSPLGVSNIVNSPRFQDELARRREEQNEIMDESKVTAISKVKEIFEEHAEEAARVHTDIIADDEAPLRARQDSANTILDKVYGEEQGQSRAAALVLNADQINVLNVAIKEACGTSTRTA